MPRLVRSNPSYRKHRASGQALVTLEGRDFYLGPWRTQASLDEYDRVVGEWLAAGRRLPGSKMPDLAVVELCDRFLNFARTYYVQPDGRPTKHLGHFRAGIKLLVQLYACTLAANFGPVALENIRNAMITKGWSRVYVNQQVQKIKAVFRWGASKQLIPGETYQGLLSLNGLRAGKSAARESIPVAPVAEEIVEATIPFLSSTVAAMVKLQSLTGARPGEICSMKIGEIDRTGPTWEYRPATHKNAYRGQNRIIYIGPRAQQILRPFLMRLDPKAYVFSPAESLAEIRQRRSDARKTPLEYGNLPGTNRVRRPRKQPGDFYDVSSYRRSIAYACVRADRWAKGGVVVGNDERIIPTWHPHQLRHNCGTQVRAEFGLEAAQAILGHRSLAATQIYAEKNKEIAQKIAATIG